TGQCPDPVRAGRSADHRDAVRQQPPEQYLRHVRPAVRRRILGSGRPAEPAPSPGAAAALGAGRSSWPSPPCRVIVAVRFLRGAALPPIRRVRLLSALVIDLIK